MSNLPAPSEPRPLRVVACPHPFRQAREERSLAPGQSLGAILREVQPDIARLGAHVWVDEEYIPAELWKSTYPPPGAEINIRVLPQGAVGKIIGSIFIAIAAIVVAILVPPLMPAEWGIWAGIMGGVAALGVSIIGNIILNALIPPTLNPSRQLGSPGFGQISDSPTYGLSGGQNQANKFGPIPKIYGRHKMFPLYGAETYTEIGGDDQFLRLLFVWGVSRAGLPAVQIESLKIGDTPLGNYAGVEVEHRNLRYKDPDGNITDYGDEPLTLYTNDIHEEALSILLEQNEENIRTTRAGAREASVDITCPSGLYATDTSSGARLNKTLVVDIYFRPSGSEEPWVQVIPAPPADPQPWEPGQPLPPGAHGYLIPGVSGYRLSQEYYAAAAPAHSFTVTAKTASAVRRSLRFLLPAAGPYDIKLIRSSAPDTTTEMSQCYWSALRSINYTTPFQPPVPCAVTVLRIKASDQLNGTVDRFSGIATGIIPDWDAETRTWITRATQNPASCLREHCQGPQKMDPYADEELNLAQLQYWHEYCERMGWAYNKILDYEADFEEQAGEICASGRAATDWLDCQRSVIIDEPQEFNIGPAFTPRNSKNFSSQITYPEPVHCWRCAFKNELNDWADDERLVLLDGYALLDADGQKVDAWGNPAPDLPLATIYQSLPLLGITHPDLIFRHARFQGAQLQLRFQKHEFEAHLDQLVAHRGNRIKFAHDVLLAGSSWGRVKALVQEGEDLVGIIPDAPCPMWPGTDYAVRFRLADNQTLFKALTSNPVAAVTFGEWTFGMIRFGQPLADSPAPVGLQFAEPIPPGEPWPAVGDLFMFGAAGQEAIDLILYAVRPNNSLGAKLTAVEYDENIYLADQGPVPPHDPGITLPGAAATPQIHWVRSGGDVLYRDNDGSWKSRILVALYIPSALDARLTGVQAQYWPTGSNAPPVTLPVQPLADWEISLMPVEDGVSYDFQLRYAKNDGSYGPWGGTQSHTVLGKTAPPANVAGFQIYQVQAIVNFNWSKNADLDIAGYELRYGAVGIAWDDALLITTVTLATSFATPLLPAGSMDYLIKAIDTSGNYSARETRKTFQVMSFYEILYDESYAPRWPGVLTNYVRNPLTGELHPDSQDLAAGDDQAVFDHYVLNPYAEMTYETPEIDLGQDVAVRAWGRIYSLLGPGEGGANDLQLYFDFRTAAGAYGGYQALSITPVTGRYFKFKLASAAGNRKVTDFQPVIDRLI